MLTDMKYNKGGMEITKLLKECLYETKLILRIRVIALYLVTEFSFPCYDTNP